MTAGPHAAGPSEAALEGFVAGVVGHGERLYRHFPWRETTDPYAILVSEVMLQQTQVARVVPYYEEWLECYPDFDALAAAPLEFVLRSWQGLGYNRRGLALKRLAERISAHCDGRLPADESALRALPGVGPATAAGVLAFAFGRTSAYLETNVRTVFIHELFTDRDDVADREILPLVARAAELAGERGIEPRPWNYALLDYGAWLKRTLPNPSRRSAHHSRQSAFEGSPRQRRAWLLRAVLQDPGRTADEYAAALAAAERAAGRTDRGAGEARAMIEALAAEGFLLKHGERFSIG